MAQFTSLEPDMRAHSSLAIALFTLAACGGDVTRITRSEPSPVAPAITGIQIAPGFLSGTQGSSATVTAVVTRNGQPVTNAAVQWTTSDSAIAAVTPRGAMTAEMTFRTPGVTTISASAEGLSTTITAVSFTSQPGTRTAVVISSFMMVQYQYPSEPNRWFYAPLITVKDAGGLGGAVTSLQFSIPGMLISLPCRTDRRFGPDETLNVLPDVYGDYELAFEGARLPQGIASATIIVKDGANKVDTLHATGPFINGVLPTTYTTGRVENPLNCSFM
jgi:hypothetical protein